MKNVIIATLAITALCGCKTKTVSTATQNQFSRSAIDIGIVARDVEKSVKFYEDIVGLKKLKTFTLPKSIAGDAGLGDYKDCHIHFLATDENPESTQLKIMSFPGQTKLSPNKYIDSTCGISYLTIFVKDADKVVENLEKNNIPILGKGPASFAAVNFAPNYLIAVKDPDGNFVELIGPMKDTD